MCPDTKQNSDTKQHPNTKQCLDTKIHPDLLWLEMTGWLWYWWIWRISVSLAYTECLNINKQCPDIKKWNNTLVKIYFGWKWQDGSDIYGFDKIWVSLAYLDFTKKSSDITKVILSKALSSLNVTLHKIVQCTTARWY